MYFKERLPFESFDVVMIHTPTDMWTALNLSRVQLIQESREEGLIHSFLFRIFISSHMTCVFVQAQGHVYVYFCVCIFTLVLHFDMNILHEYFCT